MTNLDYYKSLSAEELAPYLIKKDLCRINDDDIPIYVDIYCSPNNSCFFDYESALEVTIEWLSKDIMEGY